ncbi:hypothetical protein [Pyrobaculum sp.]|uniref:hypothetical protein n=1 Tax=Pyrobaculum sp. TaxID=2004705 RepID=UPI003D0EEF9E
MVYSDESLKAILFESGFRELEIRFDPSSANVVRSILEAMCLDFFIEGGVAHGFCSLTVVKALLYALDSFVVWSHKR